MKRERAGGRQGGGASLMGGPSGSVPRGRAQTGGRNEEEEIDLAHHGARGGGEGGAAATANSLW